MNHNNCITTLKNFLSDDQLLTDPASCTSYSYDNGRHHALPIAVTLPTTTEQVQHVVHTCIDHHMPITARGRGTGTPGGAVATHEGIIISFERMDQIISFCPDSRYMLVQPGVLNQTVQDLARSKNLFWGPDPSSQAYCTIGGNAAYNAGGPHTLKYGSTRDNVLYLEAVTGTGMMIKTGCAVTKSACGYDLTHLLIGSEGTLALFTEICLKLRPLPKSKKLLQAWFTHQADACTVIMTLMNQPIALSALEFMDGNCLQLLRAHSALAIPNNAQALLLIEVDGDTQECTHYIDQLRHILKDALHCTCETEPEQAWAARKALSPILRHCAPYKINEDIVLPIHQLQRFLTTLAVHTQEAGIQNVNFGHAGNGNIHVNLLVDQAEKIGLAEQLLEKIFTEVIALGGTLSGEHGIGLEKKKFLSKAYSENTLSLMKAIKQQFDPHNILNPDKLLP